MDLYYALKCYFIVLYVRTLFPLFNTTAENQIVPEPSCMSKHIRYTSTKCEEICSAIFACVFLMLSLFLLSYVLPRYFSDF